MFGKNEIVGKSYFKSDNFETIGYGGLDVDELLITSIFATLQGEGPLSGQRAIFIRLAKCNLACKFCDSYFDNGTLYTYDDVYNYMMETVKDWYKTNDVKSSKNASELFNSWNLVITGGEPLLQPNIFKFINKLSNSDYLSDFKNIQIETNGILPLPTNFPDNVMLVVSPKCSEKNGKVGTHIKPHDTVIKAMNCFKFVLTADTTSPYHGIPIWAKEYAAKYNKSIYVSPMNVYLKEPQAALEAAKSNREIGLKERSEVLERISFWENGLLDQVENRKNHEYAALFAMRNDCILSLQTHLLASLP